MKKGKEDDDVIKPINYIGKQKTLKEKYSTCITVY